MVQLVSSVQGFQHSNGSRNQQIQGLHELISFIAHQTRLASTAEPELGTAQPQLV